MFLSARHKSTFIPTGLRLSLDMRTFVFGKLRLVSSANQKVEVLKELTNKYDNVVMVDDLSFGQEVQQFQRYDEVIAAAKQLNVTLISGKLLESMKY